MVGKLKGRSGSLAVVLAASVVGAAVAQTTVVPGGVELTLGVSQRLEVDDNLPLSPTKPGNSYQARTDLSFALKSETPNDSIALSASTVVRGTFGDANQNNGVKVDDPRFTLTYGHTTGNGGYSVAANFRRTNLQFLRPLTDFVDASGNIILPTDLADLFGTGFRTDYGVNGAISFGANAPFGATLSLGVTGLTYDDVTNTALVDSQNRTLGTNFQLRLDDVTDASVNLVVDQFEDLSNNNTSISRTADLGLTRTLANGTAGVTLSSRNSSAGTRLSLNLNRAMALPNGGLSFGLGTTRLAGAAPSFTGNLNWNYQLPRSSLSAQFNRQISYSNGNSEQLQTTVAVGYNQTIGQRSSVSLNASYSLADPTGLANDTANTSISATYGLNVTPDWNLSVGYTKTMRDSDVLGKSDSNLVFVGLARTFNLRP